jgi:hypothetical protein
MLRPLPESTRIRCPHRVLMPRFTWSVQAGKPVLLTDELPNPLCAVCSGPLTVGRKAPRTEAVESNETEIMETV